MKKVILFVILLALLFATGAGRIQADTDYSFEYSITSSDEEWKDFKTKADMLKAIKIPDEELKKMPTKELISAVFCFPFLVDIHLYDSYDLAIKAFEDECDAYRELMSRTDAIEELSNYVDQVDKDSLNFMTGNVLLNSNQLSASKQHCIKQLSSSFLVVYPIYGTVYTPNGSSVDVIELEDYSQQILNDIDAEVIQTYPQATFVSSSTRKYNCHSYAWYSSSTSNHWWMNNPSAYMNDGSYTRVYKAIQATRVYFPNGNHSMKIYDAYANPLSYATVISKWGSGPVMIHNPYYSPYTTTGYSMWY